MYHTYYSFGAKILRTALTTTRCQRFCKTSENLIFRVSKQGGNVIDFPRSLTKLYGRHFQTFRKFYSISNELEDSLIK